MNKDKWIAALRSGKYKQGSCALRSADDEYCCLGVACDVYQQEVGGLDVALNGTTYSYNNMSGYLPQAVQDWLGLLRYDGLPLGDYDSLSTLNDVEELSFSEIADLLEKDEYGYFAKKVDC
jgi:hypothetical protein